MKGYSSEEIKQIQNWKYKCSITYFATYILFGAYVSGLGPTIVELSEVIGIEKTQFRSLFTVRGIGIIVGSVITGFLDKKVDLHRVYIGGCLLLSISGYFMTIFTQIWQILIVTFIFGTGSGVFNVLANQLLVQVRKGENVGPWMQFLHFGFGVGAAIGPLIIGYFGYNVGFNILAFVVALFSIPLYLLRCPSNNEAVINKEQQNNINIEPRVSVSTQFQQRENMEYMDTPMDIVVLITIQIFLLVGAEIGFGGWIASFSVMSGQLSTTGSAFMSSIFWFGLALGRLSAIFLTQKISVKKYLQYDLYACLASSILFIFLPLYPATIIICSFLYGAAFSSIFPLTVSFPEQMKMNLDGKKTSLIMVGASAGELVIPFFQGKMMEEISYKALIYSLLLLSSSMYVIYTFIIIAFNKSNQKRNNNILQFQNEIPLLEINI